MIDRNVATPYFESIVDAHSERYPVMLGSVVASGSLQDMAGRRGAAGFALDAPSRSRYPRAVVQLTRLLRRTRPAILHAHTFDATVVGLVAARLAGVPYVFTRHHSDHHLLMGKRWHTRVDGYCARHADAVIAVSEATRRVLVDTEHVPDDAVYVVFNGMERPADGERSRDGHRVDGLPTCITVARLHEEKGHRGLLAAIPLVLDQFGPVRFALAGQGPAEDALRREADALGIADVVDFLGQRDDVAELLRSAALLVHPAFAESFGFAVLEAMNARLPIVAAASGGVAELIGGEQFGWLVPPGDSEALARAVVDVLRHPNEAAQRADAAFTRAERFNVKAMIDGYENVYDIVLGRQRLAEDCR